VNLDQTIVNWAFGVAGALGSFVLKALWDANKDLRSDLANLNEKIGREYVRRDDFKDHAARVESMLGKIFDRLDEKMDKSN
jgi:hypothetical protein